MTDKDRELIARARGLRSTDWDIAYDLAEEADTKEAADALRSIGLFLHNLEERLSGSP